VFSEVIAIGNAVSEPAVVYTSTGTMIASFNLAINKHYKNSNGEKAQKTTFIEIKVFGKTAEVVEKYVKKGDRVLVKGELNQEVWVTASGDKRSKINILADKVIFLNLRHKEDNNSSTPTPKTQSQPKTTYKEADIEDLPEQDIPF